MGIIEQSGLVQRLAALLTARKETMATAESCTGGMIATALTEFPGASAWFFGGIVAYDNTIKTKFLDVPESILRRYGAVSEETAVIMADAARCRFGVHHAVSVTGIAGPDGGSAEKPVGTVWIGHSVNGVLHARCHLFTGSRTKIRESTVYAALSEMIQYLEQ